MVATSLIGVIAQRLIKVLCPECKTPRLSTEEENELMGIPHSIQIYEPCGCQACNNTGYRGRTAIHEIIHCNSKVSTIIAAGGTKEEIETASKGKRIQSFSEIMLPNWFRQVRPQLTSL